MFTSPEPARSRSLSSMCPHLASLVVNFCVRDDDLIAIGLMRDPGDSSPLPPPVWSRVLFNRLYAQSATVGRVGDRLDLRYASEVLSVRWQGPEEVQARADELLARGAGSEVPALLWACATDERSAIQRIGARLGYSANLIACQDFTTGSLQQTSTDRISQ